MHTAQDGEPAGSLSYETGALVRIDLTTYTYGQVVFLPTPPRIGVAARKTPSRICTEPGQALDGTSCEVQTWTNINNTVGELSPEELSVAGLLGRTGDT